MRTWLLFAFLFCATLTLSCGWAAADARYPDMVRLHVLAENDSALAQLEKLRARDAIRDCAARIVSGASDAREAYGRLYENRAQLEQAANMALRANGSTRLARVTMGAFAFPARDYAGYAVPSGVYRAVRVRLGAGEGANWWCVLYPDLCFVDEECAKAAQNGEEITFYSSVVRWIRGLFAGRNVA